MIVVIEDDLLLEDDETFTLSFALIPGEPVVLDSPDTTTVTIVDDESELSGSLVPCVVIYLHLHC